MSAFGTLTRRGLLLAGGAALGYAAGRYASPGLTTQSGVAPLSRPDASGLILNDASELSATPIHSHVRPAVSGDALVEAFRAELSAARSEGRPVSVGAARHSMGGQGI